jgi:hypothetical protein
MRPAIVVRFAMGHGANNANLIRHFSGALELLSKMNAFELGFDGAQWSAILDRREKLRVERFLRRNSSGKENINDRLGACARSGLGLELEHIAQRESHAADQADKQKLSTIGLPDMIGAATPGRNEFSHKALSISSSRWLLYTISTKARNENARPGQATGFATYDEYKEKSIHLVEVSVTWGNAPGGLFGLRISAWGWRLAG